MEFPESREYLIKMQFLAWLSWKNLMIYDPNYANQKEGEIEMCQVFLKNDRWILPIIFSATVQNLMNKKPVELKFDLLIKANKILLINGHINKLILKYFVCSVKKRVSIIFWYEEHFNNNFNYFQQLIQLDIIY
jgi:hypothetical protein